MSLHIEFEPHSQYMGFIITDTADMKEQGKTYAIDAWRWHAYTGNGNTYRVDEVKAKTLGELKRKIREYHIEQRTGYGERIAKRRLEYLRGELRAERISFGEINELSWLIPYIAKDDKEMLEAAGVPEEVV